MANRALGWVLVLLIQVYRVGLSPILGPSCRYRPTCSAYAIEAVRLHGPWRGAALAARRIGRCHPWQPGGFDPVPQPLEVSPVAPAHEPSLVRESHGS